MIWDYNDTAYKRQAEADPEWDMERRINYGLEGHKLNRALLEKALPTLRIPRDRRAFLELLLWNKPF